MCFFPSERTKHPMRPKAARHALAGYVVAFIGIAAATGLLKLFGPHVNPTTVALSFLLVVLLVATAWGSKPAVLVSLLGVVCLNYFFLPPIGTLTIRNPDNWVAFFTFLITALTAGQIFAPGKRRGGEAKKTHNRKERPYF